MGWLITLCRFQHKARLVEVGGTVPPGSPTEFGKLVADDTEKGGKVVKFSGIKPL